MTRAVGDGDTVPDLDPDAIARFTVDESSESANAVLLNTLRDALTDADADQLAAVADWLRALVDGVSADDLQRVADEMSSTDALHYGTPPMSPDDILVHNWRHAVYPYQNLMGRKAYEETGKTLDQAIPTLVAFIDQTWQGGSSR
jgi:hypothetical protein